MRRHLRDAPLLQHASHPEWGHGLVYSESTEKLHLCFEDGSRRVFLNAPRFRAQLVPVELPPRVAGVLRSRLEELLPDEPRKRPPPRRAVRSPSGAGHDPSR
jgi:hypothetical protein